MKSTKLVSAFIANAVFIGVAATAIGCGGSQKAPGVTNMQPTSSEVESTAPSSAEPESTGSTNAQPDSTQVTVVPPESAQPAQPESAPANARQHNPDIVPIREGPSAGGCLSRGTSCVMSSDCCSLLCSNGYCETKKP
jgi:hypothetical protein